MVIRLIVHLIFVCLMENFIVSFRKYRPATFDTVVGQEHITGTLKNAIRNNHLAQAFLFCGPRGVGKTTCARILAKTINCQQVTEQAEACDQCDSCEQFNKGVSLNVLELDAASNNSVDNIRELIEQVRYLPQLGRYKIFIVDEVHMLSQAAFNAFLKTLEEPPPHAIFILATTERHKVLPTILSRCQIFDFKRIKVEDIRKQLERICEKEQVQFDQDALHLIAQKADGALRDALSIFDQQISFSGQNLTLESVLENLNIIDYEHYFKATEMMRTQDVAGLMLLLDEVMFKGFDPVSFLSGLCGHFRDLLMAKTEATVKLLDVSDGIRKRYILQSREMPEGFLMSGLNIAATIEANIKTARSPRLQVELALMKMAFLTQVIDLAQVADEKKKPESVVVAPSQPALPASDSSMSPAQSPAKPIVAAPVAEPNLSLLKGGVQAIRGLSKELQEAKEKEQQRIASANSIPLSAEEFAQQWPHIIREANNAGDLFLKAILESGDAKMQGGQIHLIVRSKVEESKIQDSESWLAAHFRTYFGGRQPAVMMQMEEASPDAPVIMGTGAKSKFARMAEINPNIVALKEALDLEFVY